jgi:hypothetical protein
VRAWTLDSSERGPVASVFDLSTQDASMACVLSVSRGDGTNHQLVARFVNPDERPTAQAHACAEAARLLAVVFDTIGDLGRTPDERVRVSTPRLVINQLLGARVELDGPDACDEMVSSPLFTR